MTKTEAIRLFGNQAALARALNLSRGRISQWAEDLAQEQADRVMGAAIRLGKISPEAAYAASGTRDRRRDPTIAGDPQDAGGRPTKEDLAATGTQVDGKAA